MRKTLAVIAAAGTLLSGPAVEAAEHVVAPDAVHARLAEASADRARNLAAVDAVLATPLAREAAAAVGADAETLRVGTASLSDAELADLAARSAALEADPVAGMDRDMRLLLMIALILVIIVLLLQILD